MASRALISGCHLHQQTNHVMSSSCSGRVSLIAAHLSRSIPKVVVARNLGSDVMALLNRPDIDVSSSYCHRHAITHLQLIYWPEENHPCSRDWLLQHVPGATAIIVLVSDKVGYFLEDESIIRSSPPYHRSMRRFWRQVSQKGTWETYLISAAGLQLKVVSTMSVGYGILVLYPRIRYLTCC